MALQPDRFSAEYIEQLADFADREQLWRHSGIDQMKFTPEQQRQLDTGVFLRRHASHIRMLERLRAEGKSLLITPLSRNGTATKSVDPPLDHQRLLDLRHAARTTNQGASDE